jgi:hypothetical protein
MARCSGRQCDLCVSLESYLRRIGFFRGDLTTGACGFMIICAADIAHLIGGKNKVDGIWNKLAVWQIIIMKAFFELTG